MAVPNCCSNSLSCSAPNKLCKDWMMEAAFVENSKAVVAFFMTSKTNVNAKQFVQRPLIYFDYMVNNMRTNIQMNSISVEQMSFLNYH
jgi:hypothetical protein